MQLLVFALVILCSSRVAAAPQTVTTLPQLGWILCGALAMLSLILALLWQHSARRYQRLAQRQVPTVGLDPATGVPNRNLFDDRLAMAVNRHQRQQAKLALLVVSVHGSYLSSAANSNGTTDNSKLLCALVAVWRKALRRSDTIARLDQQTFAIVLDRVEQHDGIVSVANSLLTGSESMLHSIPDYIPLKVHIGIATYPNHGLDGVSLLNKAVATGIKVQQRGPSGYQLA
ncbi:GGDEF domain-containing protein [Ferrimonas lipolytica]|uniref:Diguanylate cyclase n=1 Tax=Ferrimonas lipolytica TaxID=2724191 RepID=A0A6H1UF69_9GAMM|nr:diguanylate cyclase [Ferrimonas lipolytica]QIZ76442.1 diguanylate cyclase [Ferrimonas lipolytica]